MATGVPTRNTLGKIKGHHVPAGHIHTCDVNVHYNKILKVTSLTIKHLLYKVRSNPVMFSGRKTTR